MPSDYLFPRRLTRRDFLQAAGATAAGLAVAGPAPAADAPPVRIGSGRFAYTLADGWGDLPAGMRYGFGCALVVDSQDRVFVTSRSADPNSSRTTTPVSRFVTPNVSGPVQTRSTTSAC